MWRNLRSAFLMLVVMTLITGLAYPLLITGIAKSTMAEQADGSLIMREGKAVGSDLIGQAFSDPKYFWSRPSATAPFPSNAGASSGSNQGPNNPALQEAVAARIKALREADPGSAALIPADLVTASASGLDPHISPEAARYQVGRVAKARGLSVDAVQQVVDRHTAGRQLAVFGEPRVNVLRLNLALDETR